MSGSVNRVTLIGNVGKQPDIRAMQNGDKVANFSLATSESWKAKDGSKQEKTEWSRIVVFGKLAEIVEKYVHKGSKVYVSGKLQTRKYEKDGQDHYTTEVVLQNFGGELVLLDARKGDDTNQDTGGNWD